jgi:hypothetical protein
MHTIEKAYNYPVDIEFTANYNSEGNFKFNLLQCRPLQTKRTGSTNNIIFKIQDIETLKTKKDNIFFSSVGNFMGGNVRLSIDYVIFVKAQEYLALAEQDKYQVARVIGMLNQKFMGSSVMLIGPGRWGTTTPSLGVPVHFSELCNITAMCEVSYHQGNLIPELSFGSHFFQDIVEADIFYAAIFDGEDDVIFNPGIILEKLNLFDTTLNFEESSQDKKFNQVIHVSQINGLTLYSDIASQELLCCT